MTHSRTTPPSSSSSHFPPPPPPPPPRSRASVVSGALDKTRWERITKIFLEAVERPQSERFDYLNAVCGDDPTVLREVRLMIAHDAEESEEADPGPTEDSRANPAVRTEADPSNPGKGAGSASAGSDAQEHPRERDPRQFSLEPAPINLRALLGADSRVGRRIGRYQLVELIGEGGMGSVFRAVCRKNERTSAPEGVNTRTPVVVAGMEVALKLIRSGMDTEHMVARFRNERRVLAGLDHPHIARILDGNVTEEGEHYIVMEYIVGVPIDIYCNRENLDERGRLDLILAISEAVAYAHEVGVVHRDLKPSNILVDNNGQVKVLDFGVARINAPGLRSTLITTLIGLPIGTLQYMSPEQILGSPNLDERADLYSLGVIAYELLAGHGPYDLKNKHWAEMARVITEEDPLTPNVWLDAPNHDLESILSKTLAKEPRHRYAGVRDFAADIQRHMRHEPILARRGWFQRRFPHSRRRRGYPGLSRIHLIGITALVTTTFIFGLIQLRTWTLDTEANTSAFIQNTNSKNSKIDIPNNIFLANPTREIPPKPLAPPESPSSSYRSLIGLLSAPDAKTEADGADPQAKRQHKYKNRHEVQSAVLHHLQRGDLHPSEYPILAKTALDWDHPEAALWLLDDWVRRDPENSEARLLRGWTHLRLQALMPAWNDAAFVLARDPANTEARNCLAAVRAAQHDLNRLLQNGPDLGPREKSSP